MSEHIKQSTINKQLATWQYSLQSLKSLLPYGGGIVHEVADLPLELGGGVFSPGMLGSVEACCEL